MASNMEIKIVNTHLLTAQNGSKEKNEKSEISENLAPNEPQRDLWANKTEYMLSVIGYVVDLGSI